MAAHMRQCEEALLTSFSSRDHQDIPDFVKWFLEGQYEKILESSDIAKFILATNDDGYSMSGICNFIKHRVEQVVLKHQENVELRDLETLTIAISCLQLFVQNNWLGPPTSKSPSQFCHEFFHDKEKDIETEALDDLSVDGETVYSRSRYLTYLYIAKVILLDCRSFFTHVQTWDWWLLRCLLIQQILLSERSPTLKVTVSELIDDISKREPLMTDDSSKDIQIMFYVEAGHACHTYFEYKKAAEHFEKAKKIAGIHVELTGAMGKRTRYQEEDKAQLILQVTKENEDNAYRQDDVEHPPLPKNLPLDDDTVLNSVKFADDSAITLPYLSPIEQTLIVGLMESYRRSQAKERLTDEEVLTYLSFILSCVSNWNVAVVALNLRSKLEQDSRRRVERSMMQLEELAKCAGSANSPDIKSRIPLFYALRVPPIWTVQRDLASLLLSLGCVGEALDVFEKLEMWEDVISCYQKLRKNEKAESVIRERLAVKETPALLCFLGDVTRNIEHYQRAWELSNHRNARSMRCMGYIYFQEENFEKAIECFETSLQKNSLQIPVWFTYGCAAMACQKFDVGVKAFKRCVSIDYDNFEAWSNLATCYVKLKEKKKAYDTLQDALKCNYENWRLWENCLIEVLTPINLQEWNGNYTIGTDCGEFEDVIRAYHRLMDLKDKWIDTEVLGILTRAVIEKIPDANGNPADRLSNKLLELFGRLTSKVTSDGDIWASYAKLTNNKTGDKEPDQEKALQYLQKAYRCFTQKADWEKDIEVCKKIGDQAISLAEIHIQCSEGKTPQDSLRLLSAAKLMMKGTLVKVQKQHTDPVTQELSADVSEICQKMETTLTDIVSRIDALRSG